MVCVKFGYISLAVALNSLVRFQPVSSFHHLNLRTFAAFSRMADQSNNRSGRKVTAPGGGFPKGAPKSDQSNRLFSVLKGAGAGPALQQGSVGDVSQQSAGEGAKAGGRKRNRSRSGKSDSGPNKAPVLAADVQTGEMDVADDSSDSPIPVIQKEKPAYLTDFEFKNLAISEDTKKALAGKMNIRYMTQVQHESLPEILKGHDVLVKAKTGTGKTLGFLVPSIEVLLKARAAVRAAGGGPQPRILVLSPTRELAQQIQQEATNLCAFHKIGTVLLVGGTNMNTDVRNLKREGEGHNDIIVATPGRMLAHLKETPGFAQQVQGVKVYVMDEADRLLDMGFKRDIDQITNFLNHRNPVLGKRMTLLFSATVAPEIREIARTTLLPGYKTIDTVGEEVEQTHSHVPQKVMQAPMSSQLRVIVQLVEQHKAQNPDGHKIILFFPTARQTGYYASVFNTIGLTTLEIHSRKSQSQRTKASDLFRTGKNVILCSSDVSARGMDYPDVSFVLQVGLTDRDQYIHRLGRTARAGKSGTGMLVLAPFEYDYMTRRELSDLPLEVTHFSTLPTTLSPLVQRAEAVVRDLAAKEDQGASFGEDSDKDGAKMAWQAWLGFYNSHCKKLNLSKEELVQKSAEYAGTIGFSTIPALQKKTIGKMGLQGVAGLRIDTTPQSQGQGKGGQGKPQNKPQGQGQGQGQQQNRGPPQLSQNDQGRPQSQGQGRPQSQGQSQGQGRPQSQGQSQGQGRPQQGGGGRGGGRGGQR